VGIASTTGTAAGARKATGKVRVLLVKGGKAVPAVGRVRNGRAVVRVPRLTRGVWAIKVRYAGDARYAALPMTRTGRIAVRR
jgi:hypothetical protein